MIARSGQTFVYGYEIALGASISAARGSCSCNHKARHTGGLSTSVTVGPRIYHSPRDAHQGKVFVADDRVLATVLFTDIVD